MSVIQTIYYGVPGTGKSYQVDKFLQQKGISSQNIFRVTFHPDYTYSDFIGQILPVSKNKKISYEFTMGIFTQALQKSFEDFSESVYLVIEEMNRGNVSAIFGDIFQLLDRNQDNISRYPVRNSLIANEITQIDDSDDNIYLPSNFNIIGTMNTSDQNLYVMDNAFKRRFNWKYMSTHPVKDSSGNIDISYKFEFELFWETNVKTIEWTDFYVKLNNFITDRNEGLGLREDKQIGQFFIDYNSRTSKEKFLEDIREKLMHYLWNDVHLVSYNKSRIFHSSLMNYSDLHQKLINNERIFSDEFIEYFSF